MMGPMVLKSAGRFFALLLLLAACAPAPQTPPPAEARLEGPVAFYPHATGLSWRYLPEGLPLDAPGYTLKVEGLGSFEGTPGIRFRFFGRGQDRVYYRQVGSFGVKLLGYEEKITLSRLEFDPPFLEYPPADLLAVGYRWGGRTRVRSFFVLPSGVEKQTEMALDYRFEVLERRRVEVPAGSFEAYVIRFTAKSGKESIASELWFVPHVGEVRTREGLLLIGKNF